MQKKKKKAERWFQAAGILTNFLRAVGRQGAASGKSQHCLRAVLLLGGVQSALQFLTVLCTGCGPPCRGLGLLGHFAGQRESAEFAVPSRVTSGPKGKNPGSEEPQHFSCSCGHAALPNRKSLLSVVLRKKTSPSPTSSPSRKTKMLVALCACWVPLSGLWFSGSAPHGP